MTTGKTWAKAGLAFQRFRDLDIVQIANHVVGSFEALGQCVTSSHILSDNRALVTTRQHELYLSVKEDVDLAALSAPVGAYLAVAIANRDERGTSAFARDSILARVLQTLHAELRPDFVKWVDTDVLLTGADFARATGLAPAPAAPARKVAPRRVTSQKALPDIEETNAKLQQRISDHDPAIFDNVSSPERLRKIFSDDWIDPDILAAAAAAEAQAREEEDIEKSAPLRLSAWMLSFAVTLFALPVGVTLLVLNLVKGENLRLAAQTSALTGTFIGFQTTGTMAQAMNTLQVLLN